MKLHIDYDLVETLLDIFTKITAAVCISVSIVAILYLLNQTV